MARITGITYSRDELEAAIQDAITDSTNAVFSESEMQDIVAHLEANLDGFVDLITEDIDDEDDDE